MCGDLMQINEKIFFDSVRRSLFGTLTQAQVDGMKLLLKVWQRDHADEPRQFLAYCLATAFHETARHMTPVRETLAASDAEAVRRLSRHRLTRKKTYWRAVNGKHYFGRGHIQLTWERNYRRFSKLLGIDLVEDPDKALEDDISAQIMFQGCINGYYTGRHLGQYLPSKNPLNWRKARAVVNGSDKASQIAAYGLEFDRALVKAMGAAPVAQRLREEGSRTMKAADRTQDIGVITGVTGTAAGVAVHLDQADRVRSVIERSSGLIEFISTALPACIMVIGGLLVWYALRVKKARVQDEAKIERLPETNETASGGGNASAAIETTKGGGLAHV